MHQIDFRWGSASDPARAAQCSSGLSRWSLGVLLLRKEKGKKGEDRGGRKKRGGKERKRQKIKGKERGRESKPSSPIDISGYATGYATDKLT